MDNIMDLPEHRIPENMSFEYNETAGNLFDYENDYVLAHCISADFALRAGIARVMDTRYDVRADLFKRYGTENGWDGKGYCLISNNGHILNLVTKRNYWEKSTYQTIENALKDMYQFCEKCNIRKIAMPRIGYGFDGLDWQKIHDIIYDTCGMPGYEIRVIYLHEYLDGTILDPDMEKINFGKDRNNIDGNTSKKYF